MKHDLATKHRSAISPSRRAVLAGGAAALATGVLTVSARAQAAVRVVVVGGGWGGISAARNLKTMMPTAEVTMVEPKAEQARVTVTGQVSPDVTEIRADPLRLKQILINLLTNAIKFNEEGGMVNVKARSRGNDILISVRDTGRGISMEHQEYLFNPYYQAAHGDQGIGTGLGLSIIKHLTELHGGAVTVESVPGTGSVFTVRLPREAKVAAETVDGQSPAVDETERPDESGDAEQYIESVLSAS